VFKLPGRVNEIAKVYLIKKGDETPRIIQAKQAIDDMQYLLCVLAVVSNAYENLMEGADDEAVDLSMDVDKLISSGTDILYR